MQLTTGQNIGVVLFSALLGPVTLFCVSRVFECHVIIGYRPITPPTPQSNLKITFAIQSQHYES